MAGREVWIELDQSTWASLRAGLQRVAEAARKFGAYHGVRIVLRTDVREGRSYAVASLQRSE